MKKRPNGWLYGLLSVLGCAVMVTGADYLFHTAQTDAEYRVAFGVVVIGFPVYVFAGYRFSQSELGEILLERNQMLYSGPATSPAGNAVAKWLGIALLLLFALFLAALVFR